MEVNNSKFARIEKIETNDLTKKEPIKVDPKRGNTTTVIQSDTDSVYCCFEEYRKMFPMLDDVQFFYHLEKQMNHFWSKILKIKADRNKMEQLIIFNRENMFTSFFSFAKKMYIGDVVDSEGDMHWNEPKKKIQGIAIKRTNIPAFCKKTATDLCFSIMRGASKQEAEKIICDTYQEFLGKSIEDISCNAGVHEYDNYAKPMSEYLKYGLSYENKTPFLVKCAVNWNYVTTKEDMSVEPIFNNGKFKYIYVFPNNKYKMEVIGYVGKWPEKFNDIFEIDYETQFRKGFLSTPEKMFDVLGWTRGKEIIPIVKSKIAKFFK